MNGSPRQSGVWYNVRLFLRLQSFLLPYKRQAALVYLLLFLSSGFVLIIPALIGQAVDIVNPEEERERILGFLSLSGMGSVQFLTLSS